MFRPIVRDKNSFCVIPNVREGPPTLKRASSTGISPRYARRDDTLGSFCRVLWFGPQNRRFSDGLSLNLIRMDVSFPLPYWPFPLPSVCRSRFRNIWGGPGQDLFLKAAGWILGHSVQRKENVPPPVQSVDCEMLAEPPARLRLTWIGHASVLVQTPVFNLLIDPMFGPRASPFSFLGPARQQPPAPRLAGSWNPSTSIRRRRCRRSSIYEPSILSPSTFDLADEPLQEPPALLRQAAAEQNVADGVHLLDIDGIFSLYDDS